MTIIATVRRTAAMSQAPMRVIMVSSVARRVQKRQRVLLHFVSFIINGCIKLRERGSIKLYVESIL